MISYIKDKDLIEHINDGYDYIIVPTNCYCRMSNGFSRKIKLLYPEVYQEDLKTKYGDDSKLGDIIKVSEENGPNFLIIYINKGYNFRPDLKSDYLEYNSLEIVMKRINIELKGAKIAAPYIGCNKFDGNGDREKVREIFEKNNKNIDLYIYDYTQKSRNEELLEEFKSEELLRKTDYSEYRKKVKLRKERAKQLRNKNKFAGY